MGEARVAVVGGSLGGLRAAEQLRRAGHQGPITVYGAEQHPPYNRPPLSKDALADPELSDARAMSDRLVFRLRPIVDDVSFRWGTTVTDADPVSGRLSWEGVGGEGVEAFDGLVIATGLRPRRLSVPGPTAGRHVLRTLEDCLELRRALAPGQRVVVVGAGFVGCETACTLNGLGYAVTVVDPLGPPMSRVLGERLGTAVQRHHEESGIELRIGPGVAGFAGGRRVTGVELTDGEVVPADLVVEAVGSVCNTEWLAGSALDLSDGVLTDNQLAAVGTERCVAVGDVARFPNPVFDDVPRRVEHWSMPTDTAKRAAATLVGLLGETDSDPAPFAPIPSFWSDQGVLRFQSFGLPALGTEVRLEEGDLADLGSGVLASYHRAGRLVGSVAINLPPARQRELRDAFVLAPEERNPS